MERSKSKMTQLLIKAMELARKHDDDELIRVLESAFDQFSELDSLVYGIELVLEKYAETEGLT
jgi:hypothetical protein